MYLSMPCPGRNIAEYLPEGSTSRTLVIDDAMAGTYELQLSTGSHSSAGVQVVVNDGDLEPVTLFDDGSGTYSYTTPYYSGFDLGPLDNAGTEINYEEYSSASYVPVLNCGTGRFYPGTDSVTYTFTEGAQYASLGDYWTRTVYGNTFTGLLGEPIVIANGIAPDSGVAKVVMTASRGGCSVSKTFWIHPYTVRITCDPPVVAWGKEANINVDFINWKNDWMARGTGPLLTFGLMDSLLYGKMWYGRESGEEYGQGDTVYNVQAPLGPNYRFGYSLKFCADGKAPTDTTTVKLFGFKTGEGDLQYARRLTSCPYQGLTQVRGEGEIKVVPSDDYCPAVQFLKTPIYAGDTVDVTVMKKINDTTFAPYPADQLFGIAITDGGIYGKLMNANGDVAQSFDSVTVPIKFIADTTIIDDNASFTILGMPIEMQSAKASGSAVQLRHRKTASCNNAQKTDTVQIVPTMFEISSCKQWINYGDAKRIQFTAYRKIVGEKNPVIVTVKDDHLVSLELGPEGWNYLNLRNTGTQEEGRLLQSVKWGDVRTGKIQCVANKAQLSKKFPLGVSIIFKSSFGSKIVTGVGSVTLSSSNPNAVYYTQAGGTYPTDDWGSQRLDHSDKIGSPVFHTMQSSGCVLTSLSMILHSAGFGTTPGTLNNDPASFKRERNGNANWKLIEKRSNNKLKNILDTSTTPENAIQMIDDAILHDDYIVANVGGHFVVVTGKENGVYTILDPGGRNEKWCRSVTLDNYSNKVYKVVTYRSVQ